MEFDDTRRRAAVGREMRTGGRIVADALVAHGISHVFAVPGESYLDVLDGLFAVRHRITLVTCRFEAAAVNMAEAHGKLTGRPAAAIVTRGPGACHGAIGVHIARQDSTPLLLFVGQIPLAQTDRESFQEVDYRKMFSPLAKWVTQIDDARRIPELIAHAIDVATTGRPGPVVIALSEDMQRDLVPAQDRGPVPVFAPQPDPAALTRMEQLLERARKPLVILGGSSWTPEGRAAIRTFLLAHDLPVGVGFRRQTTYDGTLANYIGVFGVGSDRALIAKVKEADLVIAIGSRLQEATTQGYTLFGEAGVVPIVHVYPEQSEIGRVFRPALGIVSDINAFAVAAAARPAAPAPWPQWRADLRALHERWRAVPKQSGNLNAAQAMRDLEAAAEPDAIFTCDAGNFATWPQRFIDFGERQRFIGPNNGAMGYAVPAAVAAAVIFPTRQVIALVGDGGFLMTGQEIATAFHYGAAPIVLVFNNGMYGTIRMYQELRYPGRVSGTMLTNPDFAKVMQAFGGHGEVVTQTEEFIPAFRRAAASGSPALIELRMDPEQITTRETITELRNRRRSVGGSPAVAHPADIARNSST